MSTVIIKISGGMVQDVIMDTPMEVYVLDYDNPPDFPGEELLYIDGEECVNAYFSDIVDPELVERIVAQIKESEL